MHTLVDFFCWKKQKKKENPIKQKTERDLYYIIEKKNKMKNLFVLNIIIIITVNHCIVFLYNS